MNAIRWIKAWVLAAALAVLTVAATDAPAQPAGDPTVESATFLFQSSMRVQRGGQHNRLLRSLRHLRDPQLKPFFERLFESPQPVLKIHGLLGLAECDPQRRLDLARLATIKDGRVQAEVVTAALDSQLLDNEQAKQLIQWKDMDEGAKVLAALQLVHERDFQDRALLVKAIESDNLTRRSLAAMLLTQLGDPAGMDQLGALNKSTDPGRDQVREMMMSMALRFDFDKVGPWAMQVVNEAGPESRLGRLALQTALRFNATGAVKTWTDTYQQTADLVPRTRLALVAMAVSPWGDPAMYQPLKQTDDPLISQIGRAGEAVASRQNIGPAVVALVRMQHSIVNDWALNYAKQHASENDAVQILVALVLSYDKDGNARSKVRLLDDAVQATQALVERNEKEAVARLRPIIEDAETDPVLTQGVLLGLIRADAKAPHQVVVGLPRHTNPNVYRLTLFLVTRHTLKADPEQVNELSLMVRGGGGLSDTLRLQAAWTYLKITNQSQAVLDTVLQG